MGSIYEKKLQIQSIGVCGLTSFSIFSTLIPRSRSEIMRNITVSLRYITN